MREEMFVDQLIRWIIKGEGNVPASMKLLAELLYGREIEKIRNKVCPFCNRKFKRIMSHLAGRATNPMSCKTAFMSMISNIIREYFRIKGMVKVGNGYIANNRRFTSRVEAERHLILSLYPRVDKVGEQTSKGSSKQGLGHPPPDR